MSIYSLEQLSGEKQRYSVRIYSLYSITLNFKFLYLLNYWFNDESLNTNISKNLIKKKLFTVFYEIKILTL